MRIFSTPLQLTIEPPLRRTLRYHVHRCPRCWPTSFRLLLQYSGRYRGFGGNCSDLGCSVLRKLRVTEVHVVSEGIQTLWLSPPLSERPKSNPGQGHSRRTGVAPTRCKFSPFSFSASSSSCTDSTTDILSFLSTSQIANHFCI